MAKNMGLGLRLRSRGNSFILPPGTILGGGYLSDVDTFYSHTLIQAQVINGSFFNTESDSFYAAIVTGALVISGGFFNTESDTFYTATVSTTAGPQTITGGFFSTETDAFYSSTIVQQQFITGSFFNSESDAFYAAVVTVSGGTQTILGGYFNTESDSFYSSTVTGGLAPPTVAWDDGPPQGLLITFPIAATSLHLKISLNSDLSTPTYDGNITITSGVLDTFTVSGIVSSLPSGTYYAGATDTDGTATSPLSNIAGPYVITNVPTLAPIMLSGGIPFVPVIPF